ncbi:MAG: hypothetical protein FWD25_09755 [Clostridia bacterium]|nr:hypothetical protein [Clostridia bacterium]
MQSFVFIAVSISTPSEWVYWAFIILLIPVAVSIAYLLFSMGDAIRHHGHVKNEQNKREHEIKKMYASVGLLYTTCSEEKEASSFLSYLIKKLLR